MSAGIDYAISRMHMKDHVDPRWNMSFSGVDYKAIVFMPMDVKILTQYREALDIEIDELQTEIRTLRDLWTQLSTDYQRELLRPIPDASRIEELLKKLRKIDLDLLARMQDRVNIAISERERLKGIQPKDGKFMSPIELGDLQTISISSYRDKAPVRGFGRVSPKSYVRGARTIGGSLIFTIMNRYALYTLLQGNMAFYSTGVKGSNGAYPDFSAVLPDQLPPFDITIIGSNELGDNSYAVLYGVEILTDGVTNSIEDMATECVMQFVARDYDPLRPLADRTKLHKMQPGQSVGIDAEEVVRQAKSQSRRRVRLNPFV